MSFATPTLQEGGVDYLTCTAQKGNGDEQLLHLGTQLLDACHVESWTIRPWQFKGYSGFSGGPVVIATREDSTLLKLSSAYAAEFWQEAAKHATNSSRVDLQLTYKMESAASIEIQRILKAIRSFRSKHKGGPTLGVRLEEPGGMTIYLGKRTSDRFGRIYDKGAESGLDHYKDCIRLEVQFNNQLAWSTVLTLVAWQNKFPANKSNSRLIEEVRGHVIPYFSERGLPQEFTSTRQSLLRSARSKTNVQSQLEWLRQGVSPSIKKLVMRGFAQDVVNSLFDCDVAGLVHAALTERLKVCNQQDVSKIANSTTEGETNVS